MRADNIHPLQCIVIHEMLASEFVRKTFDAAFCCNYFDGDQLILKQVQMIGEIDLAKYQRIYRMILEAYSDQRVAMMNHGFGLNWRQILPILRKTVHERLEKYERRRFTITNADHVATTVSAGSVKCADTRVFQYGTRYICAVESALK